MLEQSAIAKTFSNFVIIDIAPNIKRKGDQGIKLPLGDRNMNQTFYLTLEVPYVIDKEFFRKILSDYHPRIYPLCVAVTDCPDTGRTQVRFELTTLELLYEIDALFTYEHKYFLPLNPADSSSDQAAE